MKTKLYFLFILITISLVNNYINKQALIIHNILIINNIKNLTYIINSIPP